MVENGIVRMAGKMAAAESKHSNVPSEELAKNDEKPSIIRKKNHYYQFRISDLFFYVFSTSIFAANVVTDSIVIVEYFLWGHETWAYVTMALVLVTGSIIQLFSLRWHYSEGSLTNIYWILHFLFLGVLQRYLTLLCAAVHSLKNKAYVKEKNWVHRQESDICMLHLFESFIGALPQLILQLYIMTMLHHAPPWICASVVASFSSLIWSIVTHTKAAYSSNHEAQHISWFVLILQTTWHVGMLTSRIIVLTLLLICIREWFLLFFGLHWLSMTIWVIFHKTDFCTTMWEERIFNCIIGLIYCFDFFNLREGKSRYRVLIFYSLIVTQNVTFVIAYLLYFEDSIISGDTLIAVIIAVISGMVIGLASMIFYYYQFHPSRSYRNRVKEDSEAPMNTDRGPRSLKQSRLGTPSSSKTTNLTQRCPGTPVVVTSKSAELSPKCVETVKSTNLSQKNVGTPVEIGNFSELYLKSNQEMTADKQSLLVNIVGSDSIDDTVGVCQHREIEKDQVVQSHEFEESISFRSESESQKKDNTDLEIRVENLEREPSTLSSQRRRGICSLAQLIIDVEKNQTDEYKEEPELEDSSEEIIVCPILTFKNKKDLLSKDFQQKEETMSHVTSIHDYENVCPLGVARPPWCIRSWKGYTDIETYYHDDSVVRDRRRDTLTSTTGTTFSSDYSDATCITCSMKDLIRSKHDDYLDTLTYDLVEPCQTFNDTSITREDTSLFIGRPVLIDDKDGMLALDTILEEREDSVISNDSRLKSVSSQNSFSTLVSTIDQIRQCTAENSPRHVYHRTESPWDDDCRTFRGSQLVKVLFKNDLSQISCQESNQLERSSSFLRRKCELDAIRELIRCKSIKSVKKTPLINAILSDSPILGNRTKLMKHEAMTDSNEELISNENDLYVDMCPLVNEKVQNARNVLLEQSSYDNKKLGDSTDAKPNFSLAKTKSQLSSLYSFSTGSTSPYEKSKKVFNYPKRKFSSLKEKFEPKSRLVYVVSANRVEGQQSNDNLDITMQKSSNIHCTLNKENLVPVVNSKHISDQNYENIENNDKIYENEKFFRVSLDLKERRHVFLEQALSPSKLLSWSKKN